MGLETSFSESTYSDVESNEAETADKYRVIPKGNFIYVDCS